MKIISIWLSLAAVAPSLVVTKPANSPEQSAVSGNYVAKVQDEPVKAAEQSALQTVEIVASTASFDPRRDDTASKVVITGNEISRYGDPIITETLKRVPGVTVRGGGDVRLRGLGNGYTQILVNGERAPSGFSLDQVQPASVERIEIIRGAAADLSTQSIAGTINIVLKRAVKPNLQELRVGVGRSHFSRWANLNSLVSDRVGRDAYSLSTSAFQQTYDRFTSSTEDETSQANELVGLRLLSERDRGHNKGLNIVPRVSWNLDKGGTLTSESFATISDIHVHGQGIANDLIGERYQFDSKSSDSITHYKTLRTNIVRSTQPDGLGLLEVKVGLNGSLGQQIVRQVGYASDTARLQREVLSKTRERGVTSSGKIRTRPHLGHVLSTGWELSTSRRDEDYARSERSEQLESETDRFRVSISRLAFYGQDDWTISEHFSSYFGLRWEGLRTSSRGTDFDTLGQHSRVWSPIVHTLYKVPGTRSQFRGSLSRTFKDASLESLIPRRRRSLINSPVSPDYIGNPFLKPEVALGFDLSYEHYWTDNALLSLSASSRRIDDVVRRDILRQGGRWTLVQSNNDKASIESLEIEVKGPLRMILANAPAVDGRLSLSRNWSRVRSVPGPANRLDAQIPFSGAIGLDYVGKGGGIKAGASFAFSGGGLARVSESLYSYSGVQRDLDAYAVFRLNSKAGLRVAFTNLLGHPGIGASKYIVAGDAFRRSERTETSRLIRLTLEIKP
ncbi:TonB-dependent receptor plug domain-containing protein [Pseudoduganella chitinolytica]|uniref:TonB-dependent receptor n=1 Tax=Pseudoduganella chitinolytica TaxID=34070 RepID=A0ABY8B8R3_9BURK|nr:TonB-dependent receptor [Pseudoduganella chitinolytica]WEF32200.1 TonB-dependent receptor [Pseudoduganella chitinolytica]